MDKFLKTQITKLTQETYKISADLLTSKERESVSKTSPPKKSLHPDGFTGELYQTFKESTPILIKLCQKYKRRNIP